MPQFAPPKIDARWACVASDAKVALAACVVSQLSFDGLYLPLFSFPEVKAPYTGTYDLGVDGYFDRLLGTRTATFINNAIAKLQSAKVLLLGLTRVQQAYLQALLPEEMLVEINSVEDLHRHVAIEPLEGCPVRCKASELVQGLMEAKGMRRHLEIDDEAGPLPRRWLRGGEGVVVIETGQSVDDLAAVNYAFAIQADIALAEPPERLHLRSLAQRLRAYSRDRSAPAFREVRKKVTTRIKGIDFRQYEFATFFTDGLPYGLVLDNVIPCTHVMRGVQCGVFLANCIAAEEPHQSVDSALLFSPGVFESDEVSELTSMLEKRNFSVKTLLGKEATVEHLALYGGYYPFDLLHICSHGGETHGYYSVQEFEDRQGKSHRIEFFEVVGFSPAHGGMIKVNSKKLFTTLDNLPWGSPPLKMYPSYVFEDLLKAISVRDSDTKRVRVETPIAGSCHIECSDSIHQGGFQSLAGLGQPVVFNNSCSSSHELASSFTGAGARAYIGTLWPVGNNTATEVAKHFYTELMASANVLGAFFAANRKVQNPRYRNVYILWGLHFTSLRSPTTAKEDKVLGALIQLYERWLQKCSRAKDPTVKRELGSIGTFLAREIVRRSTNTTDEKSTAEVHAEAWEGGDNGAGELQNFIERGVLEF